MLTNTRCPKNQTPILFYLKAWEPKIIYSPVRNQRWAAFLKPAAPERQSRLQLGPVRLHRVRAVHYAMAVRQEAGHEAGPRGRADRVGRVASQEPGPLRGEPVQVGSPAGGRGTDCVGTLLIGHQDKQIGSAQSSSCLPCLGRQWGCFGEQIQRSRTTIRVPPGAFQGWTISFGPTMRQRLDPLQVWATRTDQLGAQSWTNLRLNDMLHRLEPLY